MSAILVAASHGPAWASMPSVQVGCGGGADEGVGRAALG